MVGNEIYAYLCRLKFHIFSDILDVCTGGVARIEKALAENFIHIFVNNSERLTEFLEHMIKV